MEMNATIRILWQRLDVPGVEWCEIVRTAGGATISGIALFSVEGAGHRVEYRIDLDGIGRTRTARIDARGPADRSLVLDSDGEGRWLADGAALHVEAGGDEDDPPILDIDLGFSPVTNSLPIWRFGSGIAAGERRTISVAWVLYPSLEVVVGRQSYTRIADLAWRYQSSDFVADLQLGHDGLIEAYAGYWQAIGRS
jgi:hypothetical protein